MQQQVVAGRVTYNWVYFLAQLQKVEVEGSLLVQLTLLVHPWSRESPAQGSSPE
jgi:hypothetical protein